MQILKVRCRTPQEFFENYSRDLPNGGLFCPTTVTLKASDEVIVELNLEGLPNKVLVRGAVRWWRPALPRLRVRAGALVEFEESEREKRDFVLETLEGRRTPARRRRHTRIPIEVAVRYRTADTADFRESGLREISVGGGVLRALEPLPLGAEVILEITPPGGAGPMEITGRVTYLNGTEGAGLRFVYRDGGGARRIRELLRRLRQT
ncbi:MAG TPA: PilZ domain-containing protein [Polyangia bacterium]|jgi:Tfp pilus assembly protein PilZ